MNELLITTKALFEECYELMEKKNADYSGGECFHNFFLSEAISKVSAPKGILVRIGDKIARIGNLLDSPNQVKNESIKDTIQDLINYAAILYSLLEYQEKPKISIPQISTKDSADYEGIN